MLDKIPEDEDTDKVAAAIKNQQARRAFINLADDLNADAETLAFWETDEDFRKVAGEFFSEKATILEQIASLMRELVESAS